jgi:hypothetical protein
MLPLDGGPTEDPLDNDDGNRRVTARRAERRLAHRAAPHQ